MHSETDPDAASTRAPAVSLAQATGHDSVVVGAWRVHAPDAPFAWHLCAFHADGIAMQTNPQRPDSTYIDSTGLGHWRRVASGEVYAQFSEVRALRSDGSYAGTSEIVMKFRLDAFRFTGRADTVWVDADGRRSVGPETALVGEKLGRNSDAGGVEGDAGQP